MNMAVDGSSELPIRVVSRRLLKASDPCFQPHVAPLSNLDLYAGDVQVSILCLYSKVPAAADFAAVVATFDSLLPALLNDFHPFAGRIGTNPSSGLPELLCHNQGAELVVGEVAGVALGSLDYVLADRSLKKMMLPFAQDVALSVQLLSFHCGGFSVVWGTNHLLCDGHGIITFVRMWSELARTGTIVAGDWKWKPSHDRSLFSPRSPPSYNPSLAAALTTFDPHQLVNVLTAHDSFVDRLYYIDAADIARLRDMASTKLQRASRVQAVSAYLWKVLAAVVAASRVPEERCRMGWWVSARRRLASPDLASATRNYLGNVTTYACGDATVEEIKRKSLAEVAAMAREPVASVNYDEYIQDLVDFVEVHKGQGLMETPVVGLGSPTLSQSVFDSFPLDTDFGFGQAALAVPISDFANLCSAYLSISSMPAGNGSWAPGSSVPTYGRVSPPPLKPTTSASLSLSRRSILASLPPS